MFRRLLVASCMCMAAYQLYIPLPEGYEEPWKTRVFMYTVKAFSGVINAVNYLGNYDHPLRLFQVLAERTRESVRCEPQPGMKITDHVFDGVTVRVYDPEGRSPHSPAVVYLHGGGWVLLSIDNYDCLAQQMALRTKALFVTVEYRLAPDHVYPAAIDDCMAAVKYLFNNAESFGVDPQRVAVAGDSAGGHLSAVVSLKLRDEKFPHRPASQIMIYPATQAFDFNTPSYRLYGSWNPTLTKYLMLVFWGSFHGSGATKNNLGVLGANRHVSKEMHARYSARCDPHSLISGDYPGLGKKDNRELGETAATMYENLFTDPYMSPLLADDLTGLPKAYVVTVEIDVLRDDGLMYVTRLRQARNDVVHQHYSSAFHGTLTVRDESFKARNTLLTGLINYIVDNV